MNTWFKSFRWFLFTILLTLFAVLSAVAQTNSVPTAPAVPGELQPLLNLLLGHNGWLSTVMIWMSALRIGLKWFSGMIQSWAAAKLAWNVDKVGSDHDLFLRAILSNKAYRLVSFLLDLLLSLKLPKLAEYEKQLTAQETAASPPVSAAPLVPKIVTLILATSLMAAMLTGCATTPTDTAGKIISTAAVTVDHAMQGWAIVVNNGQATDTQQASVRDAYGKYQLAITAAQSAHAAAYATNNTTLLDQAIAALQANQSTLLALVASFTPAGK